MEPKVRKVGLLVHTFDTNKVSVIAQGTDDRPYLNKINPRKTKKVAPPFFRKTPLSFFFQFPDYVVNNSDCLMLFAVDPLQLADDDLFNERCRDFMG